MYALIFSFLLQCVCLNSTVMMRLVQPNGEIAYIKLFDNIGINVTLSHDL